MKMYAELTNDEIEIIYKKISKNVKRIRLEKNKSQEEISLAMGFTSQVFYSNAENSKQNKHFNLEHIIKIAHVLDIDIKDFFEGIKTLSK